MSALRITAALAGALILAGCSGGSDGVSQDAAGAEPGNETLTAMLARSDELSVVATALNDAGLARMFDGAADYTLLAPRDAAFSDLGQAGAALLTPEQRPAMIAVLREHLVPGYLTPADIAKAIERDDDGKVQMRNMAGRTLTFADSDGSLTVTGEDGTSARFAGDALLATNGAAIPVAGLAIDVGQAPSR